MRRRVIAMAVLAAAFEAGSAAAAPAETIEGEVTSRQSRWTADGSRIVTLAVIRSADGSERVVRQAGGAVGGIGMRVLPGPPLLAAGDRVRATVAGGWLRAATFVERRRSGIRPQPTPLGFVRTTNDLGAPLYWASGCVHVTYDAAGTTDVPGTTEFAVMDASLARWRADTQACSYLELISDGTVENVETGLDAINLVKFRHQSWCRPAVGDDPEECHSPSAAGLTTLFYVEDSESSRNGQLLDADIELNAVNFAISVDGNSASTGCLADLANTFTHEVGHLLGLDHTCWDGIGERPLDDGGNPVPSCTLGLSPEITESTMYPFQECGETKKASPEADDIDGVCAIYPIEQDPARCERVDLSRDGCCRASDGPTPGTLVLLLALGFAVRRPRSRRAQVSGPRRRGSPRPWRGCP